MPLHAVEPAPERILALGPAGSSKTTGFLNICKFSHITKSPARFHIMDSDFAMDRMLTGYREIPFSIYGDPNFQNPDATLIIYPVFEWREYTRAMDAITRTVRPGDWVAVDFISNAWSAVQEHYVSEVFHQDIGDYFLQVRKDLKSDAKSLGALEGWVDYAVINPLYNKWINQLLYRGRHHVYCTAKIDNLSNEKKPTEDAQVRQLFARWGIKPVGQKNLPFQFHTLLLTGIRVEPGKPDAWTITTVKDREREKVSGLPVVNFTSDYLVNIAGWSLT